MKNLRTIEELCEQREGDVYVVAALPKWEHYSPEHCPAPIRKWVEENHPYVAIEQITTSGRARADSPDEPAFAFKPLQDVVPGPLFLVEFNVEQAEHFEHAWSNPPLHTVETPADFYFMRCVRPAQVDANHCSCTPPCFGAEPAAELLLASETTETKTSDWAAYANSMAAPVGGARWKPKVVTLCNDGPEEVHGADRSCSDNEALRTIEQVYREQAAGAVYAVAVEPSWVDSQPGECPRPISEWLEAHCPGTEVERLWGLEWEYQWRYSAAKRSEYVGALLPHPVFRIAFTLRHAEEFLRDLDTAALGGPDAGSSFYFVIYDRPETYHVCGWLLSDAAWAIGS